MGDNRTRRFIATLRSSPRKRRKLAWLVGSFLVLAVLTAVVLILPNTAGKPKPVPEAVAPQQGGTGPFWIVASVLLIGFLVSIAFVLIRFVWRMHKDEVDDPARPGAYTFPNPRLDPEQLTHPSPE